jgi:D-xylonolactonase
MGAVEAVVNRHCTLGENPLWNERDRALYWTDIDAGRLYRYFPESGRHECFHSGEVVGGFTFQDDDTLLLFEKNRIARLWPDGRREVLRDGIDGGMNRFNDVMADPEGRVYAGTIGKDAGLFLVERDLSIQLLFRGTTCSNGMGFTPDLQQMYWTCSTRRKIFRYDYDRTSGALTNEVEFYAAKEGEGTPDGMTVDSDGNVWTTRWDGFAMFQLSPAGEVLQKIDVPVAKVSSVAFGGDALDEAYLTTAGGRDGSDTADGTLYRVRGLGKGKAEFRSKVGL